MSAQPAQPVATSISQTDYGPLALWLALTTNQAFVSAGAQGKTPAQSISDATGVDAAKVQSYLDRFAGANSPKLTVSLKTEADVFDFVSNLFQDVAKDVMTGIFYPQNGCPKTLTEVEAVANLGSQQLA